MTDPLYEYVVVLCAAYPMSEDHKPNRVDERKRIEQAGGVVVWAGTWRVGGVLAGVPPADRHHLRSEKNLMTTYFAIAERNGRGVQVHRSRLLLSYSSRTGCFCKFASIPV